jgi:hypothetical protein
MYIFVFFLIWFSGSRLLNFLSSLIYLNTNGIFPGALITIKQCYFESY